MPKLNTNCRESNIPRVSTQMRNIYIEAYTKKHFNHTTMLKLNTNCWGSNILGLSIKMPNIYIEAYTKRIPSIQQCPN